MTGRLAIIGGAVLLPMSVAFIASMVCGDWPDPVRQPIPWIPDAIVVLGGGDHVRAREALRLADEFPNAAVIVTGDGGAIWSEISREIFPASRLIHEEQAATTYENATRTGPILDGLNAKRVVLVSNWFHIPRSLAVFKSVQPGREFAAAFEPKPDPMTPWDSGSQLHERWASLGYLFSHRIWCF